MNLPFNPIDLAASTRTPGVNFSGSHTGSVASELAGMDPRFDPSRPRNAPAIGRYREMTIDELLLENRVIFLVGEINHSSGMGVVMRLLHLQNSKPGQDINLYINSPGGAVDDTLAMIDTMAFLSCDVATYCIGKAMSGGALTLAAGTKGKRYCLPHAKVMIHQPSGGIYGQTTDVQIQAEEILKTKDELNQMLADFTGQPLERVTEDSERDRFFNAKEAQEYGLVDEVISKPKDPSATGGGSAMSSPGGPSEPDSDGGPSAGPQTA